MSSLTPPTATGLVDVVTGRAVRRHPDTGVRYVRKAGWPHFCGRALDALVVMVVAGVLMGAVHAANQDFALGTLGSAMSASTGVYVAVMAAVWFAVVVAYGMVWGSVGSLGDVVAGMRSVRISDGRRSGAWRGGWRAFWWSFAPFYLLVAIAAAFEGSGDDTFDSKYTAVDLRSGLAQGRDPVPESTLPGPARVRG
ncbi:RDD family protein [Micromonospora echinospora]|uniref:RDD family protein n=1 Tax=Micromonospora echinospora TaxID=1877 RepID=UPI00379B4867